MSELTHLRPIVIYSEKTRKGVTAVHKRNRVIAESEGRELKQMCAPPQRCPMCAGRVEASLGGGACGGRQSPSARAPRMSSPLCSRRLSPGRAHPRCA
jgi:hypothetical protein